ncbi:hypothetical protein [Alcanivorax sp.]|uniref:hypothetical protein n=1 Tax=Alcanivorax sp. TaxID=1872427 RepID=UPI000C0E9262|nr:hypothetical protein [Alcanivorax sp.]PHR67798.1 MAG: hypothetical protein COA55_04315 [Alcanivorax sp.]
MMQRLALLFSLFTFTAACSFQPGIVDDNALREGATQHAEQALTVRASVISDSDAHDIFGVALGIHGIQAVWLEVDNHTGTPLYYLPVTTDQQYFSPLEVAWKVKGKFGKEDEKAVDRMFVSRAMPINLPTGKRTSGFVFTNRDLGVKVVNVDLLGGGKSWQSSFIIDVPGIKLDVDEARDYLPQDMIFSQRLAEFGYVRAMEAKHIDNPGHNLTGDPFITDGLRLVIFFHNPMTPMHEVKTSTGNSRTGTVATG